MDFKAALQATSNVPVAPREEKVKPIHVEGWCWKLGGKRASWKKRWFTLLRNRLYYCELNGSPPINFILIDEGTVIEPQKEKLPKYAKFGFSIKTTYTHRIYYIATEQEEDQKMWIQNLTAIVEAAQKKGTEHVHCHRAPETSSFLERVPVLDVLVRAGEFAVQASSVKIRIEVQLGQLMHRTFGVRMAKGSGQTAQWDSDCTFSEPAGVLEIRVLADKEVVGIISLEEDLWTQYHAPTTLRIDTHNPAMGFVDVKLHHSFENDRSALLYHKGITSKVIPFRLDAGDLLVFSSTHLLSYGTKLFTMSKWDHVALVVRWFNNKLRLIEAIDDGVKLFELDERLALCSTATIAVRHLNVERTDDLLDRLHAFVQNVRGRPFKRDLLDLARAAGHFATQEDMSSMFCSQLCAAAYQAMGLLSKSKATTEFMPRDWAGKDLSLFPSAPGAQPWTLQRLSKYCTVTSKSGSNSSSRLSPRSHYTQRAATIYNAAPPPPVGTTAALVDAPAPATRRRHSRNPSEPSASSFISATPSPPAPSTSPTPYQPRSPRGNLSSLVQIGSERTASSGRLPLPRSPTDPTLQLQVQALYDGEQQLKEAKTEAMRKQAAEDSRRYSALPDFWAALADQQQQQQQGRDGTSPLRPTTNAHYDSMNVIVKL